MDSLQSFIVTNNGAKIGIKANFFRIDYSEKVIYYKLSAAETVIKMSFNDFDYILLGKNKFKTFRFNNEKEVNGYFVLAETASKSLILSSVSDEENSVLVQYIFYVVDSNSNVIERVKFDNSKNSKSVAVRGDIFSTIRFYFGDCTLLMDRIVLFDNSTLENLNLDILGFFDTPLYIECLNN
jgi:hypothetical protein